MTAIKQMTDRCPSTTISVFIFHHPLTHLCIQLTSVSNYPMGQCIELEVLQQRSHPVLGTLREVFNGECSSLLMSLPISNEDEYMSWSKGINKLRYNMQIRDDLYLPLSQVFNKNANFCSSLATLDITLPAYSATLQETIEEKRARGRYFTEHEIWYLISILTRYLMYVKKTGEQTKLSINRLLVSQEGRLKVIPELLDVGTSHLTEILSQSIRLDLSSKNSAIQKTSEAAPHDFPIYMAGVIALQAADLNIFAGQKQKTQLLQPQEVSQIFDRCKERYSSGLIQILVDMMSSKETSQHLFKISKKVQAYAHQLQLRLQSGVRFGQFQTRDIKQSSKYPDYASPKCSNFRLKTDQRKQSICLKKDQNLGGKSDVVMQLESDLGIL